jgi:DNA-binding FadR family transcriptional regulator
MRAERPRAGVIRPAPTRGALVTEQPLRVRTAERPSSAVSRQKLGDQVLERLLARVGSGEFAAGSYLPSERDLMEEFGVGRPSVREALQALELMGFLTIVHGEGARVLPMTAHTIISQISRSVLLLLSNSDELLKYLKEARVLFEAAMVRLAAERATPEEIETLRAALARHRDSIADSEKFLETDMAFHNQIAAITGNPIYLAISQAMLGWLREFHLDVVQTPGAEKLTYAEHARLFKLIAAGDAAAAEKLVTTHIRRASKKYQRLQTGAPSPARK